MEKIRIQKGINERKRMAMNKGKQQLNKRSIFFPRITVKQQDWPNRQIPPPLQNHPKIEIFLLVFDEHFAFGELQSSKKIVIFLNVFFFFIYLSIHPFFKLLSDSLISINRISIFFIQQIQFSSDSMIFLISDTLLFFFNQLKSTPNLPFLPSFSYENRLKNIKELAQIQKVIIFNLLYSWFTMIAPLLSYNQKNRTKTTLTSFDKSYKHQRYEKNQNQPLKLNQKFQRVFSIAKSSQSEIELKIDNLQKKRHFFNRSYQQFNHTFVFHLMSKSNNEELISQLLSERGNWTKNDSNSFKEVNFIWGNVSSIPKSRLAGKQLLSRVRGSNQITQKGNLYSNVVYYCEKRNLDLSFLPITFYLNREGPSHLLKESIKEFIQLFNYVQNNTNLTNTWIMKPINMNQGRDIHLFSSLQHLVNLLKGNRLSLLIQNHSQRNRDLLKAANSIEEYVQSNRSLIIQKYIENPFLLKGHKFDMRIWVLLDHLRNFYVFEEGYLRFSSEPYKLDANTVTNNFMHLTNHSLQKHSPKYSQLHSIQPISILKDQLLKQGKVQHYERILAKINEIITITMRAGFRGERKSSQKSFQLFGYDFLIDRELNVRLIEANCNPAISLDNPLLEQLVPKMLNDMFKLTLDKVFKTKNPKNYCIPRLESTNAWLLLGNLAEGQHN